METFSALLALCAGNLPVTSEFPSQRPVTRSFDVFFDLLLNKQLSKQLGDWWFEMPLRSLWRHCNGESTDHQKIPTTKGQLYEVLIFSLLSAWISCWTNSWKAPWHIIHMKFIWRSWSEKSYFIWMILTVRRSNSSVWYSRYSHVSLGKMPFEIFNYPFLYQISKWQFYN